MEPRDRRPGPSRTGETREAVEGRQAAGREETEDRAQEEVSASGRSGKPAAGIKALALFFAFGTAMSGVAAISLLCPGSFLEPMWRLNPRARTAFAGIGIAAPFLLAAVCGACALAGVGLWRLKRWGYWAAVLVLMINLTGDLVNTIAGTEPRAAIGIPITAALLAYLATRRVRGSFVG